MIYILTAMLAYLEYRAAPIYNGKWCGFGAMLQRSEQQPAPMAYRVLALPFVKSFKMYILFKGLCIYFALLSVQNALGDTAMIITAALLPLTFWYDYWDWGVEMAGLYFAISGDFYAAVIFAVLWGMSRETAPLGGVAYTLATGDIIGGAIITASAMLTLYTVRRVVGKRPLYCDRIMMRVNSKLLTSLNSRAWASFALIILICVAAISSGKLFALVPLVLVWAGVIMGKLDETRLFASALPLLYFLL